MRRFLVLLGAIVIVGAGAGVAYASIPAADGTIHGCYKNSTGMLIAIDSAASCPSGYTALNWSQTGPQGPAGATGPQGPRATAQDVTSQVTYSAGSGGTTPVNVTLDCPAGTLALNGGVDHVDQQVDAGQTLVQAGTAILAFGQENPTGSQSLSLPRPVNSGASWRMQVGLIGAIENCCGVNTTLQITVTYYVICE
jgi:hypothetical protein